MNTGAFAHGQRETALAQAKVKSGKRAGFRAKVCTSRDHVFGGGQVDEGEVGGGVEGHAAGPPRHQATSLVPRSRSVLSLLTQVIAAPVPPPNASTGPLGEGFCPLAEHARVELQEV